MRHTLLTLVCWACCSFAEQAWAQTPAMPSTQEIEQRMRTLDLRMPGAAELQRSVPSMPNVDALPALPAAPAPDLAEMASRYEQMRVGSAPGLAGAADRGASGLLVFVSLGMPVASLQALVADAEQAGALLILRGVKDGSLKVTKTAIHQLIGKRQVAWRIDPTMFKALQVQAVPTYVLMDPNQPPPAPCQDQGQGQGQGQEDAGQCGQPAHTRVAGDVTMRHALQAMAQGEPSVAAGAGRYLRRLERSRP
jgi:conjugal transfer pilus assembly protein TrbC